MALPKNLSTLHEHEEKIRADSLAFVDKNLDLREHLSMIHSSMSIIYSLAQDHSNASDDELTIQYLGLRLFNSAASSLKLGLSGYYQSAFAIVRDVVETVALLDYMKSHPAQISVWKASDKKQRINKFGPGSIRKALNQRDQFPGNKRKDIYELYSEYAAHATAPGFQLLAPEGLGKIGPFFSEKYLKAWIGEAVKFLVHGATIFMAHFGNIKPPLIMEKATFLDQATRWYNQYLVSKENKASN